MDAMIERAKWPTKLRSEREKANRLPRQHRTDDGGNPLPHRQAGTHRRQSDVDVAQISRVTVYKMKMEMKDESLIPISFFCWLF